MNNKKLEQSAKDYAWEVSDCIDKLIEEVERLEGENKKLTFENEKLKAEIAKANLFLTKEI